MAVVAGLAGVGRTGPGGGGVVVVAEEVVVDAAAGLAGGGVVVAVVAAGLTGMFSGMVGVRYFRVVSEAFCSSLRKVSIIASLGAEPGLLPILSILSH